MTQALLVSNALLWLCVFGLSAVVFALVRQLGVLHERLAPVGALAAQTPLTVGDAAPRIAVETLDGTTVEVGAPLSDGSSTLMFFLSPTCPVCKTLLPTLLRIGDEESPALRLLFASDGNAAEHVAFVGAHSLEGYPYVLSRDLGLAYHVSKLPYAVLIDEAGVVRAKGLVNTREHVESLLVARVEGVASIQEYVADRDSENASPAAAGGRL